MKQSLPACWRLYIYSLKPPKNPNKVDALAARGEKVFESEGCAECHTPPLYTKSWKPSIQ